MKTAAIALAVGTMLTVEQRDTNRANLDYASAAIKLLALPQDVGSGVQHLSI